MVPERGGGGMDGGGGWRCRRKEVDGPRNDAGDKAPTMRQAPLWQYISEECSRLEVREKAS